MTIAAAAERASGGRFKTLIVGGGIAGLSLAALLQRWDERPVIVERAGASHAIGYNLGIYPVGAGILHGLGLFPRFAEASEVFRKYELYNGVGQQVAQWDLTGLFDLYGPIRGIRRAELIDLLASTLADDQIIYEATISTIEPSGAELRVTFSDGSVGSFDLVVGADGINSRVRELIMPPTKIHTFDTQWGCLVSWAAANLLPADTTREYWGAGFFIGLYGAKGEIGVVVAGPRATLEENRVGFFDHVRRHLKDAVASSVLDLVEQDSDPFFWKLLDVRADDWTRGRVVLLGDAADAFLPTAGIGASMAMLSAAALADELSRTDAVYLPAALRRYQHRQQPKVIAAQRNSRKLAHLMMVQSPVMAWGREALMNFYGPDGALKDIIKVMDGIV